jgi:formylglycine-generating enzyme required for sulfatase activity
MAPKGAERDPGPNPACPSEMRLVEGTHYERMSHLCLDSRVDTKDTHCYRYHEGLSLLEGPTSGIRVCMDQFEAPNQRGAKPLVLQSYRGAKRWCEKRGKRLCSETEWELACEGPHHFPLAYGWTVDKRLCNSAKQWLAVNFDAFGKTREEAQAETDRLWQGTPSGRYRTCVSAFGVYDMMGNVEEWVGTREGRSWPGALMGGFWAKPWTGCRGTNDAHEPDFAFYETGFRCCKEPSGGRAD